MNDYIVFSVGTNLYAIDVTFVERIVQIPNVTPVVNAHSFIDGMMVYENKTTKILNFRKAVGMDSQEDELADLFNAIKEEHYIWVETLKEAVIRGGAFPLSTDSDRSLLGKWLAGYSSHDPQVILLLKGLIALHTRLYEAGQEALTVSQTEPAKGGEMISTGIEPIASEITDQINTMIHKIDDLAKYQQKLVIYHGREDLIALKVDAIEDIALIDQTSIKQYVHSLNMNGCLATRGVVEHKGKLVIVVESISLPHKEG